MAHHPFRQPLEHNRHHGWICGTYSSATFWLAQVWMDGWIRLIVGFQPLMVISPTASWCVCMYWTRLVLVRPAASLYSASPLKHHATCKQWCPNPDHYSDSEPARWSLTLLCWALSRAAENQILTSFVCWSKSFADFGCVCCPPGSPVFRCPCRKHLRCIRAGWLHG